jgi:hypothetical protein
MIGLVFTAAASADPTGSKNAFMATLTCDNGMTLPIVVNSANGQGAGQEDKTTAEWSPAHVIGSKAIFHPTVFDLTFTFTPAGGAPQTFTEQDSRLTSKTKTVCSISGSASDPAGDTFVLSGHVSGWLS